MSAMIRILLVQHYLFSAKHAFKLYQIYYNSAILTW